MRVTIATTFVLVLLLGACRSIPSPEVTALVGTREWLGPLTTGQLLLRADGTFRLSEHCTRGDAEWELSGDWRPAPSSWYLQPSGVRLAAWDGVDLVVRESHSTKPGAGPHDGPYYSQATEINALVNRDSATYLGVDGVVDLNWGF